MREICEPQALVMSKQATIKVRAKPTHGHLVCCLFFELKTLVPAHMRLVSAAAAAARANRENRSSWWNPESYLC